MVRARDVITVCQSFSLTNDNYNAYLSSNWDILDGLAVLFGLLGILFENVPSFRALRAIRPLRIAVRIEQCKTIISALVRAVPGMVNTLIFSMLFWVIISIMGVKFFSDGLWSCQCLDEGDTICAAKLELVTTRSQCLAEMINPNGDDIGEWSNAQWNFDNVYYAIHTVFTVSSLSGWAGTMYQTVNSRGINWHGQGGTYCETFAAGILPNATCYDPPQP